MSSSSGRTLLVMRKMARISSSEGWGSLGEWSSKRLAKLTFSHTGSMVRASTGSRAMVSSISSLTLKREMVSSFTVGPLMQPPEHMFISIKHPLISPLAMLLHRSMQFCTPWT